MFVEEWLGHVCGRVVRLCLWKSGQVDVFLPRMFPWYLFVSLRHHNQQDWSLFD